MSTQIGNRNGAQTPKLEMLWHGSGVPHFEFDAFDFGLYLLSWGKYQALPCVTQNSLPYFLGSLAARISGCGIRATIGFLFNSSIKQAGRK